MSHSRSKIPWKRPDKSLTHALYNVKQSDMDQILYGDYFTFLQKIKNDIQQITRGHNIVAGLGHPTPIHTPTLLPNTQTYTKIITNVSFFNFSTRRPWTDGWTDWRRDGRAEGQMDRWMDGLRDWRTDKASHRVACPKL